MVESIEGSKKTQHVYMFKVTGKQGAQKASVIATEMLTIKKPHTWLWVNNAKSSLKARP